MLRLNADPVTTTTLLAAWPAVRALRERITCELPLRPGALRPFERHVREFSDANAHRGQPAQRAACSRYILGYHGRTMVRKRAGRTVKVSVSLDRDDVAALKRHARESYGGNLSAAFAEAARWIRQQQARRRLIDDLGGPTLTTEASAALGVEQQGGARYEPRTTSRRKRHAA